MISMRPGVRVAAVMVLVVGGACHSAYRAPVGRLPERYPVVLTARWALRLPGRAHRGPWEACWRQERHAFLIWYGPFGQTAARLWVSAREVTWDNVPARERWVAGNHARGWEALVGLPLQGDAFLAWLAGRFQPPGMGPEAAAVRVQGLDLVQLQGRYRAFSFRILQFPDGRQWRQEWTTPWGPTVRTEYRYRAGAQVPMQVLWTWTDPDRGQVYTARWDALEWVQADCRIPDRAAGAGYRVHRVEDWFTGQDPMLVHVFRSLAR